MESTHQTRTLDELIKAAQQAEHEAAMAREATQLREQQEREQREIEQCRQTTEDSFSAELLAALDIRYTIGDLGEAGRHDHRAYSVLAVDASELRLYFDVGMGWTLSDPGNGTRYFAREQSTNSNDRGLLLCIAKWRGF